MAICRCLHRSRAIRDCSHRVTGATGILLFYSQLDASKKLRIRPNRRRSTCLAEKEMSADVVSTCKAIVVRREEEARRQRKLESKEETEGRKADEMGARLAAMEEKMELIYRSLLASRREGEDKL